MFLTLHDLSWRWGTQIGLEGGRPVQCYTADAGDAATQTARSPTPSCSNIAVSAAALAAPHATALAVYKNELAPARVSTAARSRRCGRGARVTSGDGSLSLPDAYGVLLRGPHSAAPHAF